MSLSFAPNSAVACLPAPSGIVGWWPGDGNANDIIGTNNGTLQGGATANAAGTVDSCFSFDGTNGYVQVPDSSVLEPSNLTVEAWVKFSSLETYGVGQNGNQINPGHQYIVFKQNNISGVYQNFGIAYGLGKDRYPNVPAPYTNGDIFYFNVMDSAGNYVEVDSPIVIATNVWYHVAGVRGPNYIQLYVNGQLQGQVGTTGPQDYSGSWPLYFGTTGQSFWDGKLNGMLDEVSFYNRPLASNEIASIYNAGAAGKCKELLAPVIAVGAGSSGSVLNLTFSTQIGPIYYLQYKNLLTDSNWQAMINVAGTGGPLTFGIPAATPASRYFRLMVH
jgi:hypothetical protein